MTMIHKMGNPLKPLMRPLPDGSVILVNGSVSPPWVKNCVVAAPLEDDFVVFQTARCDRKGLNTTICVRITTSIALPITLTMQHKTSRRTPMRTCQLVRSLPDGIASLVDESAPPLVRNRVIVGALGEDAFVSFQTAFGNR